MSQVLGIVLFVVFASFSLSTTHAQAQRVQLTQLIEQLQGSPNDEVLREKIIALAKTIAPVPAMPNEAERRMARGTEAFKEAKSTADFQNAVKEFQQATLAAPWSADAYFNLGLAQDKAEDFEGSLRSLKLALLASPDSKDIKDLYYKVEYQRDKAAEQKSATAKEAAEQQRRAAQEATVYQGLDGGIWVAKQYYYDRAPMALNAGLIRNHTQYWIEVHGHEMVAYFKDDYNAQRADWNKTFTSRQFKADIAGNSPVDVTISDDGQVVMADFVCSAGKMCRNVYQRVNLSK